MVANIECIGDYLWKQLRQIGVRHVFGVPGDFNLQLLEQLENVEGIEFVGTCNELNAAYAADGYARLNGIAAIVTTYGVGEFSALNGIVGSMAENVPVICITGAPPLHAMESRMILHHTLGDGDFDKNMVIFQNVTAAQTRLTSSNAQDEITRVLNVCETKKQPVYIQLPSDVTSREIQIFKKPHAVPTVPMNEIESLLQLLKQKLCSSRKPVILIDWLANRMNLASGLKKFAESLKIPYATLSTGKAILDERNPLYIGVYSGSKTKSEAVRERIETSDCLIMTSPLFMDFNSGWFTQNLPQDAKVCLCQTSVVISDKYIYRDVSPSEVIDRLTDTLAPTAQKLHFIPCLSQEKQIEVLDFEEKPLTQARVWPLLAQKFILPGDVVVAEAGTPSSGLGPQKMPNNVSYISSSHWCSIGFTLPAILGTSLSSPSRRHILFMGDGSFQMSAQELSTILREGMKPIIFLINNKGYTIERFIKGMNAKFNDVSDWDYTKLPQVFCKDPEVVYTASVRSEKELETHINSLSSWNGPAFIEIHLDAYDAPAGVHKLGPQVAEFNDAITCFP